MGEPQLSVGLIDSHLRQGLVPPSRNSIFTVCTPLVSEARSKYNFGIKVSDLTPEEALKAYFNGDRIGFLCLIEFPEEDELPPVMPDLGDIVDFGQCESEISPDKRCWLIQGAKLKIVHRFEDQVVKEEESLSTGSFQEPALSTGYIKSHLKKGLSLPPDHRTFRILKRQLLKSDRDSETHGLTISDVHGETESSDDNVFDFVQLKFDRGNAPEHVPEVGDIVDLGPDSQTLTSLNGDAILEIGPRLKILSRARDSKLNGKELPPPLSCGYIKSHLSQGLPPPTGKSFFRVVSLQYYCEKWDRYDSRTGRSYQQQVVKISDIPEGENDADELTTFDSVLILAERKKDGGSFVPLKEGDIVNFDVVESEFSHLKKIETRKEENFHFAWVINGPMTVYRTNHEASSSSVTSFSFVPGGRRINDFRFSRIKDTAESKLVSFGSITGYLKVGLNPPRDKSVFRVLSCTQLEDPNFTKFLVTITDVPDHFIGLVYKIVLQLEKADDQTQIPKPDDIVDFGNANTALVDAKTNNHFDFVNYGDEVWCVFTPFKILVQNSMRKPSTLPGPMNCGTKTKISDTSNPVLFHQLHNEKLTSSSLAKIQGKPKLTSGCVEPRDLDLYIKMKKRHERQKKCSQKTEEVFRCIANDGEDYDINKIAAFIESPSAVKTSKNKKKKKTKNNQPKTLDDIRRTEDKKLSPDSEMSLNKEKKKNDEKIDNMQTVDMLTSKEKPQPEISSSEVKELSSEAMKEKPKSSETSNKNVIKEEEDLGVGSIRMEKEPDSNVMLYSEQARFENTGVEQTSNNLILKTPEDHSQNKEFLTSALDNKNETKISTVLEPPTKLENSGNPEVTRKQEEGLNERSKPKLMYKNLEKLSKNQKLQKDVVKLKIEEFNKLMQLFEGNLDLLEKMMKPLKRQNKCSQQTEDLRCIANDGEDYDINKIAAFIESPSAVKTSKNKKKKKTKNNQPKTLDDIRRTEDKKLSPDSEMSLNKEKKKNDEKIDNMQTVDMSDSKEKPEISLPEVKELSSGAMKENPQSGETSNKNAVKKEDILGVESIRMEKELGSNVMLDSGVEQTSGDLILKTPKDDSQNKEFLSSALDNKNETEISTVLETPTKLENSGNFKVAREQEYGLKEHSKPMGKNLKKLDKNRKLRGDAVNLEMKIEMFIEEWKELKQSLEGDVPVTSETKNSPKIQRAELKKTMDTNFSLTQELSKFGVVDQKENHELNSAFCQNGQCKEYSKELNSLKLDLRRAKAEKVEMAEHLELARKPNTEKDAELSSLKETVEMMSKLVADLTKSNQTIKQDKAGADQNESEKLKRKIDAKQVQSLKSLVFHLEADNKDLSVQLDKQINNAATLNLVNATVLENYRDKLSNFKKSAGIERNRLMMIVKELNSDNSSLKYDLEKAKLDRQKIQRLQSRLDQLERTNRCLESEKENLLRRQGKEKEWANSVRKCSQMSITNHHMDMVQREVLNETRRTDAYIQSWATFMSKVSLSQSILEVLGTHLRHVEIYKANLESLIVSCRAKHMPFSQGLKGYDWDDNSFDDCYPSHLKRPTFPDYIVDEIMAGFSALVEVYLDSHRAPKNTTNSREERRTGINSGNNQCYDSLITRLLSAVPALAGSKDECLYQLTLLQRSQPSGKLAGMSESEIAEEISRHLSNVSSRFSNSDDSHHDQDRRIFDGGRKTSEASSEGDDCCICLSSLRRGVVMTLEECNHTFHMGCIKDWMKQKRECPICRHFSVLPEEFPSLK